MDRAEIVEWLLEGDPSVAWQTQRDLAGADETVWRPTRQLVSSQGWGRRLVDQQQSSGRWAGGLYQPKWTSTTYTLLLLRRLGLPPSDPAGIHGSAVLLDEADWVEGGVSYWSGRLLAERCVNGMVLSIASWFEGDDSRIDSIAELLVRSAMADGGWNCRDHLGDTHSSFHTTISVLEGLAQWRRRTQRNDADLAIVSGQEFLLAHRLFRSHRTGAVVSPHFLRFSFPPRWHYDVLRGLDHFQDTGAAKDDRAADALDVLADRRRSDGRWPIGPRYSGEVYFRMEEGRRPGRWNTLRALRVLDWWNRGGQGG